MPFPKDVRVPPRHRSADFLLRPITLDDVERDFDAVVSSRDDLHLWEQSGWPSDDFTVDDNRGDVVEMVERHAAGGAFTYTVTDPEDGECLGCVYVFPHDAGFLARAERTPLGPLAWDELDAVVYFWVRTSLRPEGLDARLLDVLVEWFREEWNLTSTAYVAHESFAAQIELMAAAGLRPAFEIREHDKPGDFVAHM